MKLLFDLNEGNFIGCVNIEIDDAGYVTFDTFEEAYCFFRNSSVWDYHWKAKNSEKAS